MGPGKYDRECTAARESAHAKGALLIVIEGDRGNGFACQATADVLLTLPEILERLAADIRRDRDSAIPRA